MAMEAMMQAREYVEVPVGMHGAAIAALRAALRAALPEDKP